MIHLALSGLNMLKSELFPYFFIQTKYKVFYVSPLGKNIFQVAVKDIARLQKLKTDLKVVTTSLPDVLYFIKQTKQ